MYRNRRNGTLTFPNGLNGKRMTTNPTSRYNRILAFVRDHPGVTKREILTWCNMDGWKTYPRPAARGQHVYVFRYMIVNNILRLERGPGNNVRYFEVQ